MIKIIRKYVVIFVLSLCMLVPSVANVNVQTAYATGAEVFTLKMLLYYLFGFVGQDNDVNLTLPKDNMSINEMMDLAYEVSGLREKAEEYNWYRISDGKKLSDWYADGDYLTETLNYDEWTTDYATIVVDRVMLDRLEGTIAEFYGVPKLTSETPKNTPYGNMINVKGAFQKENILLTEADYENMMEEGLFEYPYLLVYKKYDANAQAMLNGKIGSSYTGNENFIHIISSKYPFHMYMSSTSSDYIYQGVALREKENDNVLRHKYLFWSDISNRWSISSTSEYGGFNNLLITRTRLLTHVRIGNEYIPYFDTDLYNLQNMVLYTTFTVHYNQPDDQNINGFIPLYIGQSKNNSLSYRTFLQSKYGGGARKLAKNEELVINIDNWLGENMQEVDIDNLGSTDRILEAIKNIDDLARELGEYVLSRQIVDVKIEIDAEDRAKYERVIATQGDIQKDFKESYGVVIPEGADIPENILNGLLFVAFVFGELWEGMGSYSFVLAFGCTIGAIAILIGLGKQVNAKSPGGKDKSKGGKGG